MKPLLLLTFLMAGPLAAQTQVWWEGEDAAQTNFPARSWFSADTFADKAEQVLSGGAWLSNSGDRTGAAAFARYAVEVPKRAEYSLWCRKFWKHGRFRWRFDREEWRTCGRDVALADSTPIRTHLGANWVHLGKVELGAGKHRFELELLAAEGEALTACFDAFLLTTATFTPRGKLKPWEKSGLATEGTWAFEPDADPFAADALDLSFLNEERAGASGFVQRRGADLARGDGEVVRFWGVNCGPELVKLDPESQRYLARRLAKAGVNLVRIHGAVFDKSAKDPRAVNESYLTQLAGFVDILADEGIYTGLSFYFPLWFDVRASYGLDGYDNTENKKPFALLFFDETMQAIWRAWAKELLTKPRGGGKALGREPAVAYVELQNEDSLLFYTFKPGDTIPAERMQQLELLYGRWLARRHGSIAKAQVAWGGAGLPGDAAAEGRMALEPAWNLTQKGAGQGSARKRRAEQLRFLVTLQRSFYEESVRFLRDDLDAGCLISCGNWHTADPGTLGALERWTYEVGDLIDRHGYFGGRHEGEGSSYSVREGHRFEDRSALKNPSSLPIMFHQQRGYPHIISEIGWPNPNQYRAEMAGLAACYGALQGLDGYAFFAINGPSWAHDVPKFAVSQPSVLGQFPAAAMIYRRGLVAQAEEVLVEQLSFDDLCEFGGSADLERSNLDAFRAADAGESDQARGDAGVSPLAFYVGRVTRSVGDRAGKITSVPLERFLVDEGATVRSSTGELEWRTRAGVMTVDAPQAQGAVGFLGGAGELELSSLTLRCENPYASVLVVALDDLPLERSARILVQVGTPARPHGFRSDAGSIASLGSYPLNVELARVEITLANKRLKHARTLDANGTVRKSTGLKARRGKVTVTLAGDALYTLLER